MKKEIWLARDANDDLFLFIGKKPYKTGKIWHHPYVRSILIEDEYPEIQWSDEEPTKVKLIIDK